MRKAIPHLFTLGNLVCGVLSIRAIFNDDSIMAITFVGIAALLDFFDGFVARILGVSGELGKQLDSLADNVTFGVVPGIMLLSINGFLHELPATAIGWLLFLGSLSVSALATLRLAKFNIDTRQTVGFIGMPTPGNTLLVGALYYIFFNDSASFLSGLFTNQIVWLLAILIIAIWQILPVPLMALKFKNWGLKDNYLRYGFLIISAVLILFLQIPALPIIILLYILVSMAQNALIKQA